MKNKARSLESSFTFYRVEFNEKGGWWHNPGSDIHTSLKSAKASRAFRVYPNVRIVKVVKTETVVL